MLLVRLVWGLAGSRHARFSDFLYRPGDIRRYLSDLFTGRPQRYLGHNPAGGAMVVLLLISLAAATISGIAVYGSEQLAGPLAGWVPSDDFWREAFEELHELSANLCLLLVFVHIAGVLVAGLLHGENLVKAMWTGRKAREL
jgi:cytochrome b